MILFSAFFDEKTPLIFDGAAGSVLLSRDNSAKIPDILSLTRPNLVQELHEEYLEAGCDVIETNSFLSNPLSFKAFGADISPFESAKASAILAKKAAQKFSTPERPRFAAGSVGPVFDKNGSLQKEEALLHEGYSIQIRALIEGGADILIFETIQDIIQLNQALIAVKEISKDIPVIVSLSGKNGRTHAGTPFEEIINGIHDQNIYAAGLNCEDFDDIEKDAGTIKEFSPFPLLLMPNLGLPEKKGENFVYKTTPEEFAEKMAGIIKKFDPKIVGGCCGTTPLHSKALAGILSRG